MKANEPRDPLGYGGEFELAGEIELDIDLSEDIQEPPRPVTDADVNMIIRDAPALMRWKDFPKETMHKWAVKDGSQKAVDPLAQHVKKQVEAEHHRWTVAEEEAFQEALKQGLQLTEDGGLKFDPLGEYGSLKRSRAGKVELHGAPRSLGKNSGLWMCECGARNSTSYGTCWDCGAGEYRRGSDDLNAWRCKCGLDHESTTHACFHCGQSRWERRDD